MRNSASLTGQYLSGFRQIPIPKVRREPPPPRSGRWLTVKGAKENNLQNVTASIPLGTFTCVTGVSGSGKSTLIVETLYKALAKRLNNAREHARRARPASTASTISTRSSTSTSRRSAARRAPTPRPIPAPSRRSATGSRSCPKSTERGYKPGRFSFNVKGGRCEACQGDGVIKIEMHFLPDVYVQCDVCKGKRYNRETLEIMFRGKSIADVLDMTVDEGCEFFKAVPVDPRQAADPAAGRPRLHPYRPAGDDAVGRRGAARQARQGTVAPRHRPHALHPRRADHRPAFRGRAQAARSAASPGRDRQHGAGDRAQSRSHQDRRLGPRSRPRRRRRRRPAGRRRPARGDREGGRELHRPVSRPPPAAQRGGEEAAPKRWMPPARRLLLQADLAPRS